jgi:ectoine hydroxylase-related dioxygenase (phytanoyl-CoA dioxygenase family)
MLTDAQKLFLNEQGYLILPDFFDAAFLAEARSRIRELFESEGDQAGSEFRPEPQTRRLANCVDKGEIFERTVGDERILEAVAVVLGAEYKLSSLNVRSANPLSDWVQPLHCDTGALPDEKGNSVCNVICMIDDFTVENGATRCVPGTHRAGRLPQDAGIDPAAAHPEEILVTGRAGSAVVMNAHLWHGGTANRTSAPRCAMHAFYTRRDKPQQQYQKRLLRAETQARLDARMRWLLALDDPLNDALCAESTSMSGFLPAKG